MTKAELLDLLRASREYVGFCPLTLEATEDVCEMTRRIDAALAETEKPAEVTHAE